MSAADIELEALTSSVAAQIRINATPKQKRLTFNTKDKDLKIVPSLLDESQWRRGRGIALIHADSETLLGNFAEWTHPSGARRLIRETGPIVVSALERVEGSWWLGEGRRPEERQEWHEQCRVVMQHLHLEPLGVYAPAVELIVYTSYGGIARCETVTETLFSQDNAAAPSVLLTLPARTNILYCMGLDAKINLRRKCGL